MRWTDLSTLTGYPVGEHHGVACGVSVNEHSRAVPGLADIKIDIITTTGLVFETICTEEPRRRHPGHLDLPGPVDSR